MWTLLLCTLLATRAVADVQPTGDAKMPDLFKVHSTCFGFNAQYGLDAYLAQMIELLDSCLRTFEELSDEQNGLDLRDSGIRNLVSDAHMLLGLLTREELQHKFESQRQGGGHSDKPDPILRYLADHYTLLRIAQNHLEKVQQHIQTRAAPQGKQTHLVCGERAFRKITRVKELVDLVPRLAPKLGKHSHKTIQQACMSTVLHPDLSDFR